MHPTPFARVAALALAVAASPAGAHDFWLQPERFRVEAGDPLALTLLVGHGEDRQRSPIPQERITTFLSLGPRGAEDRLGDLHVGRPAADATLRLIGAGTHLLALETDGKLSSLPARRFDAYVAAEGLTLVAADRLARRRGLPGTEVYSRCTKAIVTAGGEAPSETGTDVTQLVGLTLEIVPTIDPTELAPGDQLAFAVLWRDAPLAGALVKLTDLNDDARPVAQLRTDGAGRVAFDVPRAGDWLLNVVWSEPLPEGHDADYLTVFSSLSLAVMEQAMEDDDVRI